MQCLRIRQHLARSRSRGFTLIELLVVISIIIILISILVPVVGKMREQAKAADTRAEISQLAARIQAYHGDFNAFPGPIPNVSLWRPPSYAGWVDNNITFIPGGGTRDKTQITMAENLYLGLMGGVKLLTPASGATPPVFQYDDNLAGQGPRSLGLIPKKYPPYGEQVDITRRVLGTTPPLPTGDFADDSADCLDTVIPEILDRFPEPIPLLYLRARTGTKTGVVTDVPIPTSGGPPAQYDQTQVLPYTSPDANTGYIGMNKKDDGEPRTSGATADQAAYYQHGFNSAPNTAATATSEYPYNIYYALRHPTIANAAKQTDGYILISAGIDRIYGTKDDITNFGSY